MIVQANTVNCVFDKQEDGYGDTGVCIEFLRWSDLDLLR